MTDWKIQRLGNFLEYADYRTYLSFDMQQIVHGEKDMKIGLSKMIKKNTGFNFKELRRKGVFIGEYFL